MQAELDRFTEVAQGYEKALGYCGHCWRKLNRDPEYTVSLPLQSSGVSFFPAR